jgi:hypothetical protein
MFVYYFLFAILLLCISLFYYIYCRNINRRHKKKQLRKKKLRFNTMSDILYYSEEDEYEKIKMKIRTKNI